MGVNGIYGLSGSGIDVQSLVKAGMLTKQTEYDKMYKSQTKDTWVKSAYADIYSSMTTFKYTTLSSYKMQSTMNAMKASSSDSTAVSATANGSAIAMSHKVQVNSLSSNAYLLSNASITRANTSASDSIYLKDSVFTKIEAGSAADTYTITASDGSTKTVSASDTAISFTVAATTDTLTTDQQKKQTISYTYADLANGKTYNDIVSDINATGTNVKASYDAANDTMSLYNSSGGKTNTITLTMAASDSGGTYAASLFNNFHLAKSVDGELEKDTTTSAVKEQSYTAGSATTVTGDVGSVTIDGKTYNDITDNKVTVSGVTYSLLNKTTSAATVSVSQDTDSIISSVKQFVTDYNKMLDSLNDKIYETQYSDYQPLTKSQESTMSQNQIEQWNTKAKSGLLYHSNILRNIVSSMREAIYTPVKSVNSDYNSASAIGISSSTNKGHLTLDEDKLKKALAADPDCVYQIFASEQDNYSSTDDNQKNSSIQEDDYNNTGIANRLYFTSMTDGLKSISSYAGTSADTDDQSSLGKVITNLQTKMSTFKSQMDAYETLLYKRYDAMETAIAQLSKQLSTVTGTSS